MTIYLSALVHAPIDDTFAYFDGAENTASASEHAVRVDVVDVQPDGRRTFDIQMAAGPRHWTQTMEQLLRIPPSSLTTRSWTWTTDRSHSRLTLITDRRFSSEAGGTRIEANIDYRLDRRWRHPLQAISNWLRRGATQQEFERQLSMAVERIEAGRTT